MPPLTQTEIADRIDPFLVEIDDESTAFFNARNSLLNCLKSAETGTARSIDLTSAVFEFCSAIGRVYDFPLLAFLTLPSELRDEALRHIHGRLIATAAEHISALRQAERKNDGEPGPLADCSPSDEPAPSQLYALKSNERRD